MSVSTLSLPRPLQPECLVATAKDHFITLKNEPAVKKQQKRVSFNPVIYIHLTIHLNDMSNDEIKDVWFCRRDVDAVKRDCAHTIKLITSDLYQGDDEDHCARGLENRVRSLAHLRRARKRRGQRSVLAEQARQRRHGITDAELIQQAYLKGNLVCRVLAWQIGLHDQEVASQIQLDKT